MDAPRSGGVYTSRPTYAEGDWGDTQGISTSQLRNGLVTTIDNSNGATLARGSYSYIDSQTISLDYVSIGKATRVKANCRLVTPSEMNCTRADGAQFKLVRRGGTFG
ncbi:hypothetical protein [Oricola sp.]|uniref:hypothetical protein n=1 Tax=Oricola sp. TaxID=1979950 RepID=UPI0025D36236|nr:hypothetical protein [Oricola sp.]MCI5074678.1 hypothetical protein [Oricola sp.]